MRLSGLCWVWREEDKELGGKSGGVVWANLGDSGSESDQNTSRYTKFSKNRYVIKIKSHDLFQCQGDVALFPSSTFTASGPMLRNLIHLAFLYATK